VKTYNNVLQLVGNTPLVRLTKIVDGARAQLVVKLEPRIPFSSVKDRIGLSMIGDGEDKGLIRRGTAIVEPTSGNTRIALAFIAACKGYRCILTMPEDENAGRIARRTAREEGLLVGISAGAAVWAALEVAPRPQSEGQLIVAVVPSFGERYLSTRLFEEG
jgi:cysteine synthase